MANVAQIVKSNVAAIEELLQQSQDRIASVIQTHIKADRMIAVTMELVSGDSKLCLCEPLSILKGVVEASQLGLLLNKHLGHGYLVPFGNGELTRRYGVQMYSANFLIGYRGFIDMVRRSNPAVTSVYSRLVYEDERFELLEGTRHELIHSSSISYRPLTEYIGAYTVVLFKDGAQPDFEWMPKDEIDKIRDFSKAKGDTSPWATWPEEMIKKTPMRRLCKRLDLSPDFIEATVRDEYRDLGYENKEARTIQMPRRASAATVQPEDENQEQAGAEEGGVQEQRQGDDSVQFVNEQQIQELTDAAKKVGFEREVYNDFLLSEFGFKSRTEVTVTMLPKVMEKTLAWKPRATNGTTAPEATKAEKVKARKGKDGEKDAATPAEAAKPEANSTEPRQVIGILEKAEPIIDQKSGKNYLELTVAKAPGAIITDNEDWVKQLPLQVTKRIAADIRKIEGRWTLTEWFLAPV